MSPGIVIAIGTGVAVAIAMALLAARNAGEARGAEADYGRELEAPQGAWSRPRTKAGIRQRAMIAVIAAAVIIVSAGIGIALGSGQH